jgi:hypothetical protein
MQTINIRMYTFFMSGEYEAVRSNAIIPPSLSSMIVLSQVDEIKLTVLIPVSFKFHVLLEASQVHSK